MTVRLDPSVHNGPSVSHDQQVLQRSSVATQNRPRGFTPSSINRKIYHFACKIFADYPMALISLLLNKAFPIKLSEEQNEALKKARLNYIYPAVRSLRTKKTVTTSVIQCFQDKIETDPKKKISLYNPQNPLDEKNLPETPIVAFPIVLKGKFRDHIVLLMVDQTVDDSD